MTERETRATTAEAAPRTEVEIGGLRLRSPIMLASGVVGYGSEYADLLDLASVGAIVTKTVTPRPRPGNRPPRLAETTSGLLNAIGLENVGIDAFVAEKLPEAAALGVPIVASVAGETPGEFGGLAGAVGGRDEVAAVELNISCPNVRRRRRPLWADPDGTADLTRRAREATAKPLFVKLSPSVADVESVAEAAADAGADALVVANTIPGLRIELDTRRPALGNATGGLSGAALLPVNLALVWRVAAAVSIPIVGSGGIAGPDDAIEYFLAGASAVQVGTALFRRPACTATILRGIEERLAAYGARSLSEIVGAARKE